MRFNLELEVSLPLSIICGGLGSNNLISMALELCLSDILEYCDTAEESTRETTQEVSIERKSETSFFVLGIFFHGTLPESSEMRIFMIF